MKVVKENMYQYGDKNLEKYNSKQEHSFLFDRRENIRLLHMVQALMDHTNKNAVKYKEYVNLISFGDV